LAAPSYNTASHYIPFIAFGLWIFSFHIFMRTKVILSKNTYLLAINYGLTLVLTIVFNWILIPRFGAYGAAYASIIIYFSFSFIGGYIYDGFKYIDLRRIAPISIVWVILVSIRYWLILPSIYIEIIVDLFFIFLYSATVLYLPFCTPKDERGTIYRFIKNIWHNKNIIGFSIK
jgi:O-antigen/teichoic acid export membrane protein